ncbi:MAG: LD-carboxypeptidase [Ferruginibacter sp.]
MKRKTFLTSVFTTAAALQSIAMGNGHTEDEAKKIQTPAYLKPGDTIGISSPAGYMSLEAIQPAVLRLQAWGFKVIVGSTIGKKDFTFGGTDELRGADLQAMINDPSIKAILCARGGYGAVRIVDQINFKALKKQPKWIIGFSDITVLHCHLQQHVAMASIHSKMCNSFPDEWEVADELQQITIQSIFDCLTGKKMQYSALPNTANKIGTAKGVLVGGNLKTIESLAGSKSDIDTAGKILFVEDTGEYLYSIDRMFWNLQRSGKLKQLSALIIGGFKIKKDDTGEEFGKTLEEIVLEKVKDFNYPVCFDFPVGHQKNNYALKCGVPHELTIDKEKTILLEI